MSLSASREWMMSGSLGRAGRRDMIAQTLYLRAARASFIMIIKPGLADRYHLWMPRQSDQLFSRDIELLMRIVRMRSHRAIDLRKSLSDRPHLRMPLYPGRDGDHAGNTGFLRTAHDRIQIMGKLRKIEVAVAVDEHGCR